MAGVMFRRGETPEMASFGERYRAHKAPGRSEAPYRKW